MHVQLTGTSVDAAMRHLHARLGLFFPPHGAEHHYDLPAAAACSFTQMKVTISMASEEQSHPAPQEQVQEQQSGSDEPSHTHADTEERRSKCEESINEGFAAIASLKEHVGTERDFINTKEHLLPVIARILAEVSFSGHGTFSLICKLIHAMNLLC